MRYLSVCSGIEAATQAWHPLGWSPVAFSEIEPFPSAVLAHHYPSVPNLGDMTKFKEWPNEPVDLLVGGTPCQSFSVAGLRKGLADPRGNLALTYLAIAERYQPRWVLWENVPGVLSSNGGRDFGSFLGGLGELGYGFAYRVLDAQFARTRRFPYAVPQRRRRVFVIGYLGDWRRAAAVLFDGQALEVNHQTPRRKRTPFHSFAPSCVSRGFGERPSNGGVVGTFQKSGSETNPAIILEDGTARYLTPLEWERGQGFPDNFTRITWRGRPPENCPDELRRAALGNSMAVNVMDWIGERINLVDRMEAAA